MEITKITNIMVKDSNGTPLKPGTPIYYSKYKSSELFYGTYVGVNTRNNIVIANPVTNEEVSIMPKAICSIFSSIADFV